MTGSCQCFARCEADCVCGYDCAPPELVSARERIAELQSALAAMTGDLATLRAELETESMRLVACSVIALANTPESAASARDMHPDYQSPYCDDVARAVDREIALRAELASCRTVKESLIVAIDRYGKHAPAGMPCGLCEAIDAVLAADGNAPAAPA